jgi:hypothetical protein
MSSPLNNQDLESYVPVYDVVPEKWEDARAFIVEQLKKLAIAVNTREIGFFLDEELLSGKAFIPGTNTGGTSQQFRQVLRKVIDFGALPNAGTKSVPHGISFTSNFTLVFMGAYATNPAFLVALPIPYADPGNILNNIAINMDSTNVNITTGTNLTSFTRCYVIIEYLQEL